MKGKTGWVVLAAAAMAFAPAQVDAQAGPRGRRAPDAPRGGAGVEHVMRLSEELQLTEDQLARLEGIRSDVVQHRTAHQALMVDLRSRVMAGQLEPAEARERMASTREEASAFSEDVRSRVETILTDDQKAELQGLARERRAFQRGRASVQRRPPRAMRPRDAFRGRGARDRMWRGRGPGG